jgi:hypothetical protein
MSLYDTTQGEESWFLLPFAFATSRRGIKAAVDVGHGKDQACFPVGPRLERSRPQSPGGLRRQHADADPFYDVPDALAVALLAHVDAPRFLRHRFAAAWSPLQLLRRRPSPCSLGTNSARPAFQPRQIFQLVDVA